MLTARAAPWRHGLCSVLARGLFLVAFVTSIARAGDTPAPVESAASSASPTLQRPPDVPKVLPLAAVPGWSALTLDQKLILAPLQHDWPELGREHRSKWLSVAARLPSLPPEEQARMQERMRDWVRLSPTERRKARTRFQSAKQVGASERQAKWEAYQALPAEKRAELADTAARKQTAAALPSLPKPTLGAQPKSNLVPAPSKHAPATAVAASLLQAKPGASTVLMTRPLAPPVHQAAGQPKVVADPSLVDPHTLLPKALRAPVPASPAAAS